MQKGNHYYNTDFKHSFMSWDNMLNLHSTYSGLYKFNRFLACFLDLFNFLCIFTRLRSNLERLLQKIYELSDKSKNSLAGIKQKQAELWKLKL